MEIPENIEQQETHESSWDRLKALKDKKIHLNDTGKATLVTMTGVGVPTAFHDVIHMSGNLGIGLTIGATILSIIHGDKAFRVGRWLKDRIIADNDVLPREGAHQEKKVVEGASQPKTFKERIMEDNKPRPERSLLGKDSLRLSATLVVHADDFLAARKLLVGVSGSGKSNSVAVICEELGALNVPFVLFDTENEYESLCDEQYLPQCQRLDRSNLDTNNASEWGAYILENNIQAIVNLLDFPNEDAAWIMINMIEGVNGWQEARPNNERIPFEIILEEATTWLPQRTNVSSLSSETLNALQNTFFNDVVRKGRKRGLGFTAVCQKIAEINKDALQCGVKILHGQSELNDLKRYEAMGISSQETLALKSGEAFVWVGTTAKKRIQMRLRRSPHGAETPKLANLRSYQSRPIEQPYRPEVRSVETTVLAETRLDEYSRQASQGTKRMVASNDDRKVKQAWQYWQNGHASVRKLETVSGWSNGECRRIIRLMKERGLIEQV